MLTSPHQITHWFCEIIQLVLKSIASLKGISNINEKINVNENLVNTNISLIRYKWKIYNTNNVFRMKMNHNKIHDVNGTESDILYRDFFLNQLYALNYVKKQTGTRIGTTNSIQAHSMR